MAPFAGVGLSLTTIANLRTGLIALCLTALLTLSAIHLRRRFARHIRYT